MINISLRSKRVAIDAEKIQEKGISICEISTITATQKRSIEICTLILLVFFVAFFYIPSQELKISVESLLGLTIIYLLKKRYWPEKTKLLLTCLGVGYHSREQKLLFPWRSIKKAYEEGERIVIELWNNQAGYDWIVEKVTCKGIKDELFPDSKRIIFPSQFTYPHAKIVQHIQQYQQSVLKQPDKQKKTGVFTVEGKQCVGISKNAFIDFPSFCPISGLACSEYLNFKMEGSPHSLSWYVSPQAKRCLKIRKMLNHAAMIIPFFLYLIYSYQILFSQDLVIEPQELIFHALMGLSIFCLTPLAWYLLQDKLLVQSYDPYREKFIVRIKDEDYFYALLQLNIGDEMQFPWQEEVS